jgi:hypothetical protein
MLNLALLRYNYLRALDTPIVCAAPAYQGLDLNESLWARNRALHYLAGSYKLSEELRYQLTQVVHGYIGRCDEDGTGWMRERYREAGRRPRF